MFAHIDFLGRLISVNDKCVFTKNTKTGSCTVRRIMYKGTIYKIERNYVFVLNDSTGEIDKIKSDDIVIVDWK